MCYFLTIGVPDAHAADFARAVPRGFRSFPCENVSILRVLPAGYRTFLLIRGMCSRDLYLRPISQRPDESKTDRLRRKYEKNGWSELKIRRALEASSKHGSAPYEPFHGLCEDVRAILVNLLKSTEELAVLVHFYSEDLTFGTIPIQGEIRTPAHTFLADLDNFVEDRVVVVDNRTKTSEGVIGRSRN